MSDRVEQVHNNPPPPELYDRRSYEEIRRSDLDELDRQRERPPEEGKGQNVDVYA